MENRKLPHGSKNETFCPLGLGMGGVDGSDEEITNLYTKAIANGINYFDLCASYKKVFAPFGKAIKNSRNKVFLQVHFGAIYDENGDYGWSRDLNKIKETINYLLKTLDTDYIDFGFLHCIDEESDFEELKKNGIFDYLLNLKKKGVVHHIGFSSHTPSAAMEVIDTGVVDMMMFSINPAYDFGKNDELGNGSNNERYQLFKRCAKEGIGISCMKPFLAGKLLDKNDSPFGVALTRYQCLSYCLDRPGVLVVLPGVRDMKDLDDLLGFLKATNEEKDYSVISKFDNSIIAGKCLYCGHCKPCPKGIDISLVNKYYDLALTGDKLAINHYKKLEVKAGACIKCGHCDSRCPFKVKQSERMQEIKEYFKE